MTLVIVPSTVLWALVAPCCSPAAALTPSPLAEMEEGQWATSEAVPVSVGLAAQETPCHPLHRDKRRTFRKQGGRATEPLPRPGASPLLTPRTPAKTLAPKRHPLFAFYLCRKQSLGAQNFSFSNFYILIFNLNQA